MPAPNTIADFWRQVRKTAGCWLWTGATDGRYGKFGFGGKKIKAHRFSWNIANGAVPDGLHVLHKCDVTLCVRPSHLFIGTHTDNMRDMFRKGRRRILRGIENAQAKLTAAKVLRIRRDYSRGARQVDLAAKFNVIQTTISKIIRRDTWRHIGE